jgi:hypothetical protein
MFMIKRTPLSFEIEHKEIFVSWHFMYERSFYIQVIMSERAKLFVIAFTGGTGAIFRLVFFYMIKSFAFIV